MVLEHKIDHYLRQSGPEWTIIKPTAFRQNFLSLSRPIARGVLPQVTSRGKVGYRDTRDMAHVADRVLVEDLHSKTSLKNTSIPIPG